MKFGKLLFKRFIFPLIALLFLTEACQKPEPGRGRAADPKQVMAARMGWAIQAGAFSNLDNAVRLSDNLNSQGLDATYFRDSDKLYKVRFGDFSSRDAARNRAESLKSSKILEAYYLIAPESMAGSRIGDSRAETGIRKSLVSTAESYLGIPYRWGGTSAKTGFDCSGLTQAVYKLNGLSIPRTSRDQYAKGNPVSKNKLRGGDLLFFSAAKGGSITHVAIYTGNGAFIHAPSSGQVIRRDDLNAQTWSRQFVGARTYL